MKHTWMGRKITDKNKVAYLKKCGIEPRKVYFSHKSNCDVYMFDSEDTEIYMLKYKIFGKDKV